MTPDDLYHVIPHGDLIEHVLTMECECQPVRKYSTLVVHNALDNREYEIANDIARQALARQEANDN